MRANYPSKSVANLKLVGAGSPIDIKVYKKCSHMSGVGLENHLYHTEDSGRIHKVNVCDICADVIEPEDMSSMASNGDSFIQLTKDQIKEIWQAGNEMKVVSCPDINDVTSAIADGTICFKDPYEISAVDVGSEFHLHRLFKAMKLAGQTMSVNVPINAQLRKGIIFPSGIMYTLFFENEIRQSRPAHGQNHAISKDHVLDLLEKIKARKRNVTKAIPKVTPEKVLSAWNSGQTG